MKAVQKKTCFFIVVLLVLTIPFSFTACKKDKKTSVDMVYNPETVPSLDTDSVSMLISDSGLIRYKMIAKTWEVYDQAKEPYWFFPRGIYVEQYDTVFNIVFTAVADTAWNFEKKKLWRLKGHVFVKNALDETFSSDELFWDQQKQRIYSDKFVRVNRPDKGILLGKSGFEANQQMTRYTFKSVGRTDREKTELYFNEEDENKDLQEEKPQEEKAE